MSDTKERKNAPQPKVRDIMNTFEKAKLQNGTERTIDAEKPISIPGGTKKLTAAYEKINEPVAPPELRRVNNSSEEPSQESDTTPQATLDKQTEKVDEKIPEQVQNNVDAVNGTAEEPTSASNSQAKPVPESDKKGSSKGDVLVVYAHPERQGLNGAMLDITVAQLTSIGYSVTVSDLYRMNFNPLPSRRDAGDSGDSANFNYNSAMASAFASEKLSQDITEEQGKVWRSELVVFISPFTITGFSPMLLGYLTRVLSPGFVGDASKMHMFDSGRMLGKKAVLCFNTDLNGSSFSRRSLFGDIEVFLWPIQNGALRFAGFEVLAPQISYNVGAGDEEDDQANVAAWGTRLTTIMDEEPISFLPLAKFDPNDGLQLAVKEAEEADVGLSVGQNLGKGFPPGGMLGGMDEVDAGGSYDLN